MTQTFAQDWIRHWISVLTNYRHVSMDSVNRSSGIESRKKNKQYSISTSITSTANKKELSEQYEADWQWLKRITKSTLSTEAEKKDVLEVLPRCEEMLDIFTREKLEGMALSAGIHWQEERERNTHFFFNSLKQKLWK